MSHKHILDIVIICFWKPRNQIPPGKLANKKLHLSLPAPSTTHPGSWPPDVSFCDLLYCDQVYCCPSSAGGSTVFNIPTKEPDTNMTRTGNSLEYTAELGYSNEQHHKRADTRLCFCSTGMRREKVRQNLKAAADCKYSLSFLKSSHAPWTLSFYSQKM